MNSIAFIILFSIIIDYFIHGFADLLNLKGLQKKPPKELTNIYEPEKYKKSQDYLRVNTLFGLTESTFSILIIIVFWFGKGFYFIDQYVKGLNHEPVLTGLIYIGILILLKGIISIPFSLYATFVIEERFGFNKTTLITYFKDMAKGLGLAVLLGTPLIAGILAFFEYAGKNGWWLCWTGVTIFMLIIHFLAPTFIMPLFNKFKPVEEGELKDAILNYADSIKFPLKNVFVMDGSKRSSKSNAFFTGFGKNKRIVLFDTLIENHTISELVAILAHEMGHFKKKHIFQNIILGIVQTGISFFLLSLFISYQGLFDAFYIKEPSVYGGLIFFGMLYSPIGFFTGIFLQALSRKNEYSADKFAVKTTSSRKSLSNALTKLSTHNLSNLTPHPFYVFLNYSHPPLLERIRSINKISA